MRTHKIEYDHLPHLWEYGLPLGNGEIGVLCWGSEQKLKFTLDSASIWDLRHSSAIFERGKLTYRELCELFDERDFEAIMNDGKRKKDVPLVPSKLYLGRFEICWNFSLCSRFSLSLEDAAVTASFQTGQDRQALRAFVDKQADIFCLCLDPWPYQASLTYIPFYETSPGLAGRSHPEAVTVQRDGLTIVLQHILPDDFFALCYDSEGPEIFVSFARENTKEKALEAASNKHPQKGFDEIFLAHKKAWKKFRLGSSVRIPEKKVELLWHYGLYILASSARPGSIPPGLQGVWAMDGRLPAWGGGYYVDMNVQQHFSPACVCNHLELLDVWVDYLYKILPEVRDTTKALFGTEGAFWICSFMPKYTPSGRGSWNPVGFAWSHTGWLMHLVWLRWRYSLDKGWLEAKGYPLMVSAFQFYSANLQLEEDGRYHIPVSSSPEYEEGKQTAWCKDPNVDIALVRKCCDWIAEMEEALDIKNHTERAREIREKLVLYHLVDFDVPGNVRVPEGTKILGLWKDKPLDQSHRHPSHLMAIYPAMDITIDGSADEKRLIDASLLQYLALGQFCWAGHTFVEMVSFAAVIGRAEMAYNFLRRFADNWTLPNLFHINGSQGITGDSYFARPAPGEPISLDDLKKDLLTQGRDVQLTLNETCGISGGISDMLIQSWGGRIRVFPATPAHWRDLEFTDLLAEGAFKVSAKKEKGRVSRVKIKATVDGPCRLRNPFVGGYTVRGARPDKDGEDLVWKMKARDEVELIH